MRYRSIGRTSIKVSEVGFGCWTMGGPNWSTANGQPIGWGDVTFDDVLAGVKAGLDSGVNHWDNADVYGNGKAERMLADCFIRLGLTAGKGREGQVVATKVGHHRGTAPHAYEPAHIRRQCEQSLRNLRTDHIDLYYFHHGTFKGPDYDTPLSGREYDYLHEAAAAMHSLVKEGKVRAVGQSAYTDEDFERAVPVVKPDALQCKANLRYDVFIRPGCRLQNLMREHGCTLVGFGPLDQGILLDKFDPEQPPKFEEGDYRASRKDFNPQTLKGVRDRLRAVKERFGAGGGNEVEVLSSVVSRWVLAHDNICSVIPGFRNARQAAMNIRAGIDPPMSAPDVLFLRDLFKES
jgi:myo-inositol catabolism protein IolS